MNYINQHAIIMWKIKESILATLSFHEHSGKSVVVVTPRDGLTKNQLAKLQEKIVASGFEFVLAGEAFTK